MLHVTIPAIEFFDNSKNEFIEFKEQRLQLEHSLVSLAKWESKWKKPFLGKDPKTAEETIDYIRCMTITQNVDPEVYQRIPNSCIEEIKNYIDDSMTATWFSEKNRPKNSSKVITAEIVYYWMIALNIPFECQKWHLNRLLTLIRVCDIENSPKKKMGKRDLASRNRSLNAARKKRLGTHG